MKIYNEILTGSQSTEIDPIDYARGIVWSEIEYRTDKPSHYWRYIDTVDGIEVYYDFAADYYFFVDMEG